MISHFILIEGAVCVGAEREESSRESKKGGRVGVKEMDRVRKMEQRKRDSVGHS